MYGITTPSFTAWLYSWAAVCLAKALIDKVRGKYLTLQDIYDVYDNDDYDAIISYALNESEEIEIMDSLGLYFIKGSIS